MLRLLWWLSEGTNALYLAGGVVVLSGVVAVILDKMGFNMIPIVMQLGIIIAVVVSAIGMLGERIKAKHTVTDRPQ